MRIALGVEYDGTAYNGWQRQRHGKGVQSFLEDALARVADAPVEAVCAGRTDTGVHAEAQVVHFDSAAERTPRSWVLGVNSNLPRDVNALWAQPVADDFHARYSALSRTYRYLILNRPVRSALNRDRAWWLHRSLDEQRMQEAASCLHGEHDFSAFRAAGCQALTPHRNIFAITIVRHDEWLVLTIRANAFLQHMVRNIVGVLVAIGAGEEAPQWAQQVLESRDRTRGGITAPAHGLTLVEVEYPETSGIPARPASTLLPIPGS
ncbi:MAG TPA: tRNA pseudouridine(38-40) synthase TruA [Woeseiaceae bacterium]|nr:tRNA pseudouridine(38-40) synthase TruA [Woeseiaceae bacterium]